MQVRSLGWQTDLFYIGKSGFIEQRERYIVARTPSNPTFYWGNLLLYPDPPSRHGAAQWLVDFAREFPALRHRCFGWDSQQRGDPSAFLEQGYDLSDLRVMSAARLRKPGRAVPHVVVRRLASDDDWEHALESTLHNASPEERADEPAFRLFKTVRFTHYRTMQRNGFGAWYGAFAGGQLVGSLGVFGENGTARFQQVEVDAKHRRRGICSKMLYEASEDYRKAHDAARFVILALNDNPNDAVSLYANAGFEPVEQMWGLWKRP